MPVPGRGHNTIEIIEIIIAPLSLPLVRLACALKLFYILSEAYGNFMLLVFRDANKILSFLE